MLYPKLIDNRQTSLAAVLLEIAPSHKKLSVATGYWDLPGTADILEAIENYESVRLLIGREPTNKFEEQVESDFPEDQITASLESLSQEVEYFDASDKITRMVEEGRLEVKIIRKPFLHAKAYIFGDYASNNAVGIIGSSNFTKAGLSLTGVGGNAELNALESDIRTVTYKPSSPEQEHGHLSWFDSVWNSSDAEEWSGEFSQIIQDSPVGNMTFGSYDIYIKTLMEVFPDELIPTVEFSTESNDILYSFQSRNAGILVKKLNRHKVAMLSDSVGLGKTITSGAVIKYYREQKEKSNVVIIVPASLRTQWKSDLGEKFDLEEGYDYKLVTMQHMAALDELIDDMEKPWISEADLIVIDEAHNLRNQNSARHKKVLEYLSGNPDSKVLLLTATPVNNSLIDFSNQIQLGAKGVLSSDVNVPYVNNRGQTEYIDFFEALQRIQKDLKQAERRGEKYDWKKREGTLRAGLRAYLVRSTRQGVELEGTLKSVDGERNSFPTSNVAQIEYTFSDETRNVVSSSIESAIEVSFEGFDPRILNLDVATSLTQQMMHPIDIYTRAVSEKTFLNEYFAPKDLLEPITENVIESVLPNIIQIVCCLGFTPYRPLVYKHEYYGKPVDIIRDRLRAKPSLSVSTQLTVHNILRVLFLKRFESSVGAVQKSVEYYQRRLHNFKRIIDERGLILSLGDIDTLDSEYSDDFDLAISDYEKYLEEIEQVEREQGDINTIKRRGIECIPLDEKVFNVEALIKDLEREIRLVNFLAQLLLKVHNPNEDPKLKAFASFVEETIDSQKYGKKVLVFSFFSDTIEYLKKNLSVHMAKIPNFDERAAFLSGGTGSLDTVVRRFSPNSKGYSLKDGEEDIDYLFATDVLSEGQNLQDAGILVNFDLHWNPVRMIQRNGRINRLGSSFDEVLIANTRPQVDLELYLQLIKKLERKIDLIRNSVGTDQSILGEQANPIDYLEDDINPLLVDDVSVAAKALRDITDKGSIFDLSDNHSFVLRSFLAKHEDDGEIERIKAIPKGKWSYLPQRAKNFKRLLKEPVLSMQRISGKAGCATKDFNDVLFFSIAPNQEYRATYMDEGEALDLIATSPEDNERRYDRIAFDRKRVARRCAAAAKSRGKTLAEYNPKPSEVNVLYAIQNYVSLEPGEDLLSLLKGGMRTTAQLRKFRKLYMAVRNDLKKSDSISVQTASMANAFVEDLRGRVSDAYTVENVEGILYYTS